MQHEMLALLMFILHHCEAHTPGEMPDLADMVAELEHEGFGRDAILNAFNWWSELIFTQDNSENMLIAARRSLRVFNAEEVRRISTEARGFLTFLDNISVLELVELESIIERALLLDEDEITLEQIKWVVLMVVMNETEREAFDDLLQDVDFNPCSLAVH